ncbi:MAG: phenylacetate--CoA ligase family protein [Deltaproteobacteria bacterium]|nr:phenylacetate--CoA ligase family protein [Deltaproteobacteria bacterium]
MKAQRGRFYPDAMDTWPEAKLRRYQLQRLRLVLQHARRGLSFYRQLYGEAKSRPGAVRSFEDFARLPTFTKKDVLDAIRNNKSFRTGIESRERADAGVLCMTSGTLGTSFLYLPRRWAEIRGDSLARAYWWAGLRPGMRMLMAAPAWHSLAVQETRVIHRLGVTCVVPWGTFLPRHASGFLAAIAEVRPDFVSIFLPMLYALLAECRRQNLRPADAFRSVQNVLVVGAPMTPLSRAKLREELGVKDLFEGLGNPEGLTAMECSHHGGHHIFVDCCYVEIIDPRSGAPLPAEKRGNVVITSLIPHGSAYIRYDTEDVGEILPGSCPCGRTWPLLEVYDRRVNAVEVARKEIFPYDVRLCVDKVPELIHIPFALLRGRGTAQLLKLKVQKPAGGAGEVLASRLKTHIKEALGVEARVEWTEELPQRWKGVAVIDEENEGRPRV